MATAAAAAATAVAATTEAAADIDAATTAAEAKRARKEVPGYELIYSSLITIKVGTSLEEEKLITFTYLKVSNLERMNGRMSLITLLPCPRSWTSIFQNATSKLTPSLIWHLKVEEV